MSALAKASVRDTAAVLTTVVAPIVARGVIARRPRVAAVEARLDTDARGMRTLQQLRGRYGTGPLRLAVPGRSVALLLAPEDMRRVLRDSPDPFATASWEKRGALSHFQPHGVLVSSGRLREERRRFNEAVLDTRHPVHRLAPALHPVIREEAGGLRGPDVLGWDRFASTWWRMVRRIVLGDRARDDHEVTDLLARLRAHANWAGLRPRRPDLRIRFLTRIQEYVARAEPGSLAELIESVTAPDEVDRVGQVPQWLFAFDAAAMAAFRALALLAGHPDQAARARAELAGRDLDEPQDLPVLRASVLESVRLWPTTLVILRETTAPTAWSGGTLPAGTALLIVSAFFHRDDQTLPNANRFDPDQWLDGRAEATPALVPFSAGPAVCAGRELVLYTSSTVLATLLEHSPPAFAGPAPLGADRPLPATLDPFTLRVRAGLG